MTEPRIEVSPLALAAAALFILLADTRTITEVLSAAFIHEMGHLAAIWILGVEVESISVEPVGLRILCRDGLVPYAFDAVIAASGPIASLLAAILASVPSRLGITDSFTMFSGLNLLYCVLNLVPITALDGGRIMCALISAVFGSAAAERVAAVLDTVCLVVMSAAGIYVAVMGGGASLAVCAAFLTGTLTRRWACLFADGQGVPA